MSYFKLVSEYLFYHFYLSWEISWQPLPSPPEVGDSWGLEPVQMQRLPGHRHDVQGTGGQHPVGSMPGNEEKIPFYTSHCTLARGVDRDSSTGQ